MNDNFGLISSERLASLLDLTPTKVQRLAREGILPHYRCGALYRFSYEECLLAIRPNPNEEDKESEQIID